MLPNEVFKSAVGCIVVAMISVIIKPSFNGYSLLADASQLDYGSNISFKNYQTSGPPDYSYSDSAKSGLQTSTSRQSTSDLLEAKVLKKPAPVEQVFRDHSKRLMRVGALVDGSSRRSNSSKNDTFLRAKSVLKKNISGKKGVFNYNFVNSPPGVSMEENMTASASSNRENWATFHANSLDDSESDDSTPKPELNSSQVDSVPDGGDQPNSSSSQQRESTSSDNQETATANEFVADSLAEGAPSSPGHQQQVQLERESFSRSEKPVVKKSTSTLTTIGDGKKKARLVSKSAPLPPGLRRRIIEEFVKKGGNPDNIVISDSTITTTSKSKKKTITTVYKVVPASGSSSPRQPRRMNGKNLLKLRQPPGKRFKKIMTVTRDEIPKNMMSDLFERPDKPNTATYTDMGLVEFDDNVDELGAGKPEALVHKSKRPALKLRVVPPPSMVDMEDDDDEEMPPLTKDKIKSGVGGGGVSLNTLMDAIKHMQQQQQQQGKPAKVEDVDLGPGDKETSFGKHLSNFNDFNGHKSSKKASSLSKNPSSSGTLKNNYEDDDEDESENEKEKEKEKEVNGIENNKTPEVEQKKVSPATGAAKSVGIGGNKVSPEQQLEELKRVVVASTEKLKERRAKTSTTGSGDQKSTSEYQKTTANPTTTMRPASSDSSSANNSGSSSNQSNQTGGSKTHNIMMLIDFSHPDKSRTPREPNRRSPRAHSARLAPHQPHSHLTAGFFPGASSWFEPDDQWHPLSADTSSNMQLSSSNYPHHGFTSALAMDGAMGDEQFAGHGARHRLPISLESESYPQSFDYMDAMSDDRGKSQLMAYDQPTRSQRASGNHLYDMTSASQRHNNYRGGSGPLSSLLGGVSGGQRPHSLAASAFMSLIQRAPGFYHHQHPKMSASYGASILPEESRGTNQLINEVIEELVMSASSEMSSLAGENSTRRAQLYSVTGSPQPTYQLSRRRRRRR